MGWAGLGRVADRLATGGGLTDLVDIEELGIAGRPLIPAVAVDEFINLG